MNIQHLKSDIPASIVVFLVALPLCLGIALASGAPMLSGIIAGIIGGIIVGFLSKSDTSVSGPAAGLAAVVLASIHQLGSFELFLTAVFLAGLIQLIMGITKTGLIADFIPTNVIKGLLSAIGIVLILKQIPHAIGYDADMEGDFQFFQMDGNNSFSELLNSVNNITPAALIICAISILILVYWDKTPLKKMKFFPSSLFVVIFGVLINSLLMQFIPSMAIGSSHLVAIPQISFNNLDSFLHIPQASYLMMPSIWTVAITIALVASLETLLNIEAVDKIDPQKRHTPPNQELIAQGIGNLCAGIFGGIPITSVIVRSSVNIQAGNTSKMSSILHGFFIILSVLLFRDILNAIPLSSLAAILLVTGYKLAKVSIFTSMYKKGWQEFTPFIATVLAIVFTDLLIGVLIGLGVGIFFLLRNNFRNPFQREDYRLHVGEFIKIVMPNQVSFLNKASIKETLWNIPEHSKVIIDATNTNYIDGDILEVIEDFKEIVAPQKNIQLNILGQKETYILKDQIEFVNVLDKDTREKLDYKKVLSLLIEGNERFCSGTISDKNFLEQAHATAHEQSPMCAIVGCIDSRATPEILFDAGIGEILTIRIAGNIISKEVVGSLEIACSKLGAKLIVIKAHSNCGAVALAVKNVKEHSIGSITSVIQDVASQAGLYPLTENTTIESQIEQVSIENVKHSVREVLRLSDYLRTKIEAQEIGIVSAYHNIKTGKVEFTSVV